MGTGETVDRLRADIDRGRTGDKVAFSDPALAPLGTDEEAAGAAPSEAAIAQARAMETRHWSSSAESRGIGGAWLLIGFILLFALVVLVWGLAAS
jgi:hypothetical protein